MGLALRVATLHRSLVTLRAGRYVNVPAFVAVRLTLRRFKKPVRRFLVALRGSA
jgi:hypothetical protein